MRFLAAVLQSIYYLFVAKKRSLLISPALDVTVIDITVGYRNVKDFGSIDSVKIQTQYFANIQYAIRNSGDSDFIAPSGFVEYATHETPAVLEFLELQIIGGLDGNGNAYPKIGLNIFATCVIDDSNTADAESCVPDISQKPSSLSMGIKQGGSYGISKTVQAKFPLTAEQFNALSNSAPAGLTFSLSVNKYISPDGAAGVVTAVDGSTLKATTTWQATGQGASVQLFPTCDNFINSDSKAVSGYGNEQSLSHVCLGTIVQSIADHAFSNSADEFSSITSILIPSSVTAIGKSAFYFTALKSVTFIGDIVTIGAHAFEYASSTGADMEVTFPGKVNTIEEYAFHNFHLKSLTFRGMVGNIGENAFSFNAIQTVTFPAGLSSIGDCAFESNALTSVTFLGTVGLIGTSAFTSNAIKSVTFPAGLSFLGDEAFRFNKLTSVTFLGAVATIGDGVFDDNSDLKTIYYPSTWSIPKTKFPDGVSFKYLG